MSHSRTRRDFLQEIALASSLPLSGLIRSLPAVASEQTQLEGVARFAPDIEPLVRLIEESARDRVLEKVGEKIRQGASYQRVLAALMLAAVRNVQPYPAVGFKFHAVLVINSCHLASMAGPDEDRWLPILWAIDYFKSSQAEEARSSGWHLPAIHASKVPGADKARDEFHAAMKAWDLERADAATVGLVNRASAGEVFEQFANYAARDFRSIGHKAIYLANAWRTLQVIGWEYAEPIFRSLTWALLNHRGDPNPATNELEADQSWKKTLLFLDGIPAEKSTNTQDASASTQFLEVLRHEPAQESMKSAADLLASGNSSQQIWDGVFLGSSELLMQQPGIVSLHSLTSANALHFLWQHVGDDVLRRRLLLQAVAFVPQFRQAAKSRGALKSIQLDQIEKGQIPESDSKAVAEILNEISARPSEAASKLYAYLERDGDAQLFLDAARRTTFLKGRDAHDYKFSSAILEDFRHVSPEVRNLYLAASVFHLKGTEDRDSDLLERSHAALVQSSR